MKSLQSVEPSNVGVETVFGDIKEEVLPAGLHVVNPFAKITNVYLGQQTVTVNNSSAASNDLQSVHSNLVVQLSVKDPMQLYKINTNLNYKTLIVAPAIQEVFKAVVSNYTAEELVTKRSVVSENITSKLQERLKPYFLQVQTVSLTNFGFSKAFNDAIEQKVTASQQAETAKRNLERVKYEAQAKVEAAKGRQNLLQFNLRLLKQMVVHIFSCKLLINGMECFQSILLVVALCLSLN